MDTSGLPFAKGETRQQRKRRDRREEVAVIGRVRQECVDRDGYCRLYRLDSGWRQQIWGLFGGCVGPSMWSHYNASHRRSKTVHQAPEDRHDRRFSMMLCAFHSQTYDRNEMLIAILTDQGCDGRLRFMRDGHVWDEDR